MLPGHCDLTFVPLTTNNNMKYVIGTAWIQKRNNDFRIAGKNNRLVFEHNRYKPSSD